METVPFDDAKVIGISRSAPPNVLVNAASPLVFYPGWASYGASKAAVDQWVRNVAAEQEERGGVHVMAITPGTVDTGMQARLRETSEDQFPKRQKFVDAKEEGKLTDPEEVAQRLWDLLHAGLDNGTVADLRKLDDGQKG